MSKIASKVKTTTSASGQYDPRAATIAWFKGGGKEQVDPHVQAVRKNKQRKKIIEAIDGAQTAARVPTSGNIDEIFSEALSTAEKIKATKKELEEGPVTGLVDEDEVVTDPEIHKALTALMKKFKSQVMTAFRAHSDHVSNAI
jgi:uncharacterized protein YjgD (DUF1641 family)